MNSTYRIVHFIPDPFSGARVPVGALVDAGAGRIEVARAQHLPGAACLGSHRDAVVVDLIAATLSSAKELNALPAETGPQAVLGPPALVPEGVLDPVRWVESFILPRPPAPSPMERERRPSRASLGMKFFKQFGVDGLVNANFHPERVWSSVPPSLAGILQPVSHWAGAVEKAILLMEPIVLADPRLDKTTSGVFARVSAYQSVLDRHPLEATFVIYLLQGGSPGERERLLCDLHLLKRTKIVNIENENDRQHFLANIRQVGEPVSSLPDVN